MKITPRFPDSYTGGKFKMPPRRASNDNRPTPVVVDELAARRAYIDSLPDWDQRTLRSWPTATRLVRAKKFAELTVLETWREQMAHPHIVPANDNEPEEGGERVGPAVDRIHEISPSEDEIASAAKLYDDDEAAEYQKPHIVRTSQYAAIIRLGDLVFSDTGEFKRYRTKAGKWYRPTENYKGSKGMVCRTSDANSIPTSLSVEDEAIRLIDAAAAREAVGWETADILDLSCGSMTAEEIAVEMRGVKAGKYAERAGVNIIDAAIDAYRKYLARDVPSIAA